MNTLRGVAGQKFKTFAIRLKDELKVNARYKHLLVALVYVLATTYFMGPSVYDCGQTLYGFGDNTAGPVWKSSLSPEQPIWGGPQSITNYPVGENLYNPTVYSLAGQTVLIYSASQIFGPVCGYNIVNIIGFIFSALAMYFFIFWLTKNRWIALFAGFAVSFSPYFQVKVGGHPGYGYQGLLVLALWSLIWLLKNPSRNKAVLTGAVTALSFYFDPYMSLLVVCCVIPFVLVWLMLTGKPIKGERASRRGGLKYLVLAALAAFVCLLPLVTVFLRNKETITGSVSALRGNVLFEARACSNLPHEYTLPFVLHPILNRIFGQQYVKMINSWHEGFACGIGEDTVGVSLVLLLIVGVGSIIVAWEKINGRRLRFALSFSPKILIIGMLAIILCAGILALPPVRVQGIPTPSYVLLHLTTIWRTLARLFVVVNIGFVVIAAVYMNYVAQRFSSKRRVLAVLFLICSAIVFFEYQTSGPFSGSTLSTFSYETDVPDIYLKVKDDQSINVLAEYPLERAGGESNATAYYLSMQVFHGKKLFNANDPQAYEEKYRASMKDITDPQTLRVLKSIGVDAVVIHGVEPAVIKSVPGLEIVYEAKQSPFNILAFTPTVKNDYTIVAKLTDRLSETKTMLTWEEGFVRNTDIIISAADWSYELVNRATMRVTELPGGQKGVVEAGKEYCFALSLAGATPGQKADLFAVVDGTRTGLGSVGGAYGTIRVKAAHTIQLENSLGFNMRIKDVGCDA